MFLTLTLPSYGKVTSTGAPVNPGLYDYRRAALDALHFAKLLDRFWQNLRRCAGYKVQYFSALEPQRRLALHAHAAIRGAIPRALLKQVVTATYVQLWWPAFDQPVYTDRLPVWVDGDYVDPDTGEVLPTWGEALDQLDTGPAGPPAHVVRFGKQTDLQGIIAPSADADRAIRYLTKYLTKAIAGAHTDDDGAAGSGLSAACRPAARRAPLAAVLVAVCELAPLRHPTRTTPGPDWYRVSVRSRRMIGPTSAAAAAASSSPGSGPARPWPNTRPTGRPWSAKPCTRPASSHPRSNGWPPPSPCRTGHRGSSGPTPDPIRASTPG